MPRLFTGLEIPQHVAQRLAFLRGGIGKARWIEPSDFHITLRFLGDVDIHTARDFARGLDDIAAETLTVTIDQLDVFGGNKPRSLFARVRPSQDLSELQSEHERLARIVGLGAEGRRFTPHVTLAWMRDVMPEAVADWLSTRAIGEPISFQAKRFVLYSSRASTGGGPYLVEAAYPLGFQHHAV